MNSAPPAALDAIPPGGAARQQEQLAWGHGERLLALPPLPSAPVLLVAPADGVGTAEAYGWLDQAGVAVRRGAVALDLEPLARWGSLARLAGNDFEGPVFGRRPDIRQAFEAVAGTGPLLCRTTGSGAAVFGVYRSVAERDDALLRLGKRHGRPIAQRRPDGLVFWRCPFVQRQDTRLWIWEWWFEDPPGAIPLPLTPIRR